MAKVADEASSDGDSVSDNAFQKFLEVLGGQSKEIFKSDNSNTTSLTLDNIKKKSSESRRNLQK